MKNRLILLSLSFMVLISACKRDEDSVANPNPVNEEELITTVELYFNDGISVQKFGYKDLRWAGGNAPQMDTIRLRSNTTYTANVVLLDESKSPADSISNEVLEEADDHLFVYTIPSSYAEVHITDADSNNLPLGLETEWHVKEKGNTSLTFVLKHQPGIKNGSPTQGETDIEIVFPVLIE